MNRFPYPDDLDNPIELMSFIVRGEVKLWHLRHLGHIMLTPT